VNNEIRCKIRELFERHRVMTIATLRPDGWPQATTMGYVSEGLTIWFLCELKRQKARNLALDNRVSITIDHDTPDIMAITGLNSAPMAQTPVGAQGSRAGRVPLATRICDWGTPHRFPV
jgi:general stress protein 26